MRTESAGFEEHSFFACEITNLKSGSTKFGSRSSKILNPVVQTSLEEFYSAINGHEKIVKNFLQSWRKLEMSLYQTVLLNPNSVWKTLEQV